MKKRLFITSALMTAVLGLSLATGTFAWYQAATEGGITVDNNVSSGIATKNDGTLADVKLDAEWSTLSKVNLSDESGNSYVWASGNKVIADNNASLEKYSSGTVTLTSTEDAEVLKGYAGDYDVKVVSDNRVRVAKDAATVYSNVIGTEVILGTLTINADGTIKTDAGANVFTFYYSVKGEDNSEEYVADTTYGTITVSVIKK